MQKELDSKYKNKLIYAFYGLGKSTTKSMDKSIYETDDILCRLFRCKPSNLYQSMSRSQKLFPDVYDYTIESFKNGVDTILKKGGTVVTSNDRLLEKADYIFIPSNLKDIQLRLKSEKRSNPFSQDMSKLETKIKKIKTIAKKHNKQIIEIDNYLSDYLFK
jgi:DNA repair ATPase RecN